MMLIGGFYPLYTVPCLVYGTGMIICSIILLFVMEINRERLRQNSVSLSDLVDENQYETSPLLSVV